MAFNFRWPAGNRPLGTNYCVCGCACNFNCIGGVLPSSWDVDLTGFVQGGNTCLAGNCGTLPAVYTMNKVTGSPIATCYWCYDVLMCTDGTNDIRLRAMLTAGSSFAGLKFNFCMYHVLAGSDFGCNSQFSSFCVSYSYAPAVPIDCTAKQTLSLVGSPFPYTPYSGIFTFVTCSITSGPSTIQLTPHP